MSKTEYKAETVGEFLGHVKEIRDGMFGFPKHDPWGPWFRGHKVADWDLRPRLYRDYGDYRTVRRKKIEDEMREEFIVRAPILCENLPGGDVAQAEWEWYFMMQHFGTPTRLLDWTEGALLALYFAIKDNQALYAAAVWVLDPFALNNGVGGAIGRDLVFAPTDPGVPDHIRKKLNLWLPRRLTKMKGLPQEAIAVYPRHTERRISTQRSCFTIHGTDQRALDKLYERASRCLAKITIPSRSVMDVRRELDRAGIDEVTIFPDLIGLGRAISARWRPDDQDLPHKGVYTRLRPSKIHGVGVFAIVNIKKDTPLFEGENPEMPWFDDKSVPRSPRAIWTLYHDFAVIDEEGRYGCPKTFNRLTPSWYLNEPRPGEKPNVLCDPKTYEFRAARDLKAGEELTVDYEEYSRDPPGALKRLPRPKTKVPGWSRPTGARPK